MMRVRRFENGACVTGGAELLPQSGAKLPDGVRVWVDVEEPTEAVLLPLGERFGLHKLALDDCLHLDQRPKIEDYGTHQFIVLQSFSCPLQKLDEVVMHELHFFLGDGWLITVHSLAHDAIDKLHTRIDLDAPGTIGKGCDFLAYELADLMVDKNFPVLDAFNDGIEQLEEQIFERPTQHVLQRAFAIKRSLVLVRRVLSPQRDVVGMLSRHGIPQVQDRTTLYFRDVYDHLMRLYEQIDTARDLLGNAMDAYLSVMANRTGDVTKQLTIFASIFMPMSFVAGFFGQNFEALNQPHFFIAMLASMIMIPLGMVLWFRHKDWF